MYAEMRDGNTEFVDYTTNYCSNQNRLCFFPKIGETVNIPKEMVYILDRYKEEVHPGNRLQGRWDSAETLAKRIIYGKGTYKYRALSVINPWIFGPIRDFYQRHYDNAITNEKADIKGLCGRRSYYVVEEWYKKNIPQDIQDNYSLHYIVGKGIGLHNDTALVLIPFSKEKNPANVKLKNDLFDYKDKNLPLPENAIIIAPYYNEILTGKAWNERWPRTEYIGEKIP